MGIYSENRKATHNYFILEKFECGIVLEGTEVKSIKAGKVNLKDSYCSIRDGQLIIKGMHISEYTYGNKFNVEPLRNRVLLMHKSEIRRLEQKVKLEGLTLVPLRVFDKRGLIKVQIALAKGKHLYDKRQAIAEKDAKRKLEVVQKSMLRNF